MKQIDKFNYPKNKKTFLLQKQYKNKIQATGWKKVLTHNNRGWLSEIWEEHLNIKEKTTNRKMGKCCKPEKLKEERKLHDPDT